MRNTRSETFLSDKEKSPPINFSHQKFEKKSYILEKQRLFSKKIPLMEILEKMTYKKN
jgi:hypothetical protein